MLATLKTADLYERARSRFERHAAAGDCEAIWNYYTHLVENRGDVGHSIKTSGQTPIEAVALEIKALYAEHREQEAWNPKN